MTALASFAVAVAAQSARPRGPACTFRWLMLSGRLPLNAIGKLALSLRARPGPGHLWVTALPVFNPLTQQAADAPVVPYPTLLLPSASKNWRRGL